MAKDNINTNITVPSPGMKMGKYPSNLKAGELSLLVNGKISKVDGGWLSISNEASTQFCHALKGYKLIGSYPVPSLSLTFVALVDIVTGKSEIGWLDDAFPTFTQDRTEHCADCESHLKEPKAETSQEAHCNYHTLVNADCLNFSIDNPVRMWVKVDDCNIRIYFVDGDRNPFRYIDYPDFQKEYLSLCPKTESDTLDCDRIKIFPSTCFPHLSFTDVVSGGQNEAGVYQFKIAYADGKSNPLTSYYYATNPIQLFDRSQTITDKTDYPVAKSIKIKIENLNTDFTNINLVVAKTVNNTTSFYLVGNFSITSDTFEYIYAGIDTNLVKRLTPDEVLAPKTVYSNAEIIADSNGYLFFADLTQPRKLNLQPVINKLTLLWQTVELNEGDFGNPILAEKYRCGLRDEVVPYGIEFWRTGGLSTARFHIPGRASVASDLEDVTSIAGDDIFATSTCEDEAPHLRWQVYNTASDGVFACGYDPNSGTSTNTITTTYDCYSSVFYRWRNSEADSYKYYEDKAHTILLAEPLPCEDCNEEGTCTDGTVEVITVGGLQTVNSYTTNPTAAPVPNIPSFDSLVEPTNNSIQTASFGASYPCDNPYLCKLNNCEKTWYSVPIASEAIEFTITSTYTQTKGCNLKVTLWYSSTGNTADAVVATSTNGAITTPATGIITQNTTRFLFAGLLQTGAYWISIETPSCTFPCSIVPVPAEQQQPPIGDNFYFICSTIPTPSSSTQENVSDTVRTHCVCTVTDTITRTDCNALNYEKGQFAFWESSELYPCNEEVWGDLAGKPIRHHKFPDCAISPHFKSESTPSDLTQQYNVKNKIYPIGIVVDVEQIKNLLREAVTLGLITDEERLSICGYRILRGNRRGNESIIAKGLINDVWKYKESGKDKLYPNYPYNPQTPDPFNLVTKITNRNIANSPTLISHPNADFSNNKYVFYGANTQFNNPGLGSELKLELELYGSSEGRFTKVTEHSKLQYVGAGMTQAALGFSAVESLFEAVASAIPAQTMVSFLGSTVNFTLIAALVSANIGSLGLLLQNYYDWLDVLTKFAPFRNYAYYFTSTGNYIDFNTPNEGNIRRSLNDAQYIKSGFYNVKDGVFNATINNVRRESSVYLNINNTFPKTSVLDDSRWCLGDGLYPCDSSYVYRPISSYYASLKNPLPSQYGQIDNIDYIDTGYNGTIDWTSTQDTTCEPIFGGDTYINRHYYRIQFPVFLQENLSTAPNSDVLYNELYNVGHPRFFYNYPVGADAGSAGTALYGNVALRTNNRCDYNLACSSSTGSALNTAGKVIGGVGAAGGVLLGIIALTALYATLTITADVITDGNDDVFIDGKFFTYLYGVPSPIIESNYNLDLRHGTNQTFGNFYPNTDLLTWTQPTQNFNLIDYDNTYFYNNTYSKQNHENLGYILPSDFDQETSDCKVDNSNRLIYSLQDNDNNDDFDGNLVFLRNNFHDFSKAGGKLTIVKGIENNKVLVIQENQASIFNSYVTLQTSLGQAAVGSNSLFSQEPQQYVKTDLGYGGSQTQAITSTEFGHFWVDNKRGQIFQFNNQLKDITLGENSWWFKEFLPFKILQDFPTIPLNNYKHFGMVITYDARNHRIIFTKRDAKLLSKYKTKVTFQNNMFVSDEIWKFTIDNSIPISSFLTNKNSSGRILSSLPKGQNYEIIVETDDFNFSINDSITSENTTATILSVENIGKEVLPSDSKYFCNQSWSISYSPLLNEFTSFLSYTPNVYLNNQNYYSSLINFPTSENEALGLWNHNLTNQSYQIFYNKFYPFILEYSQNTPFKNTILNSLTISADFLRYSNQYDFYKVDKTYSDILVYNANQTSSKLRTVIKEKNNDYQIISYPKYNQEVKEVLIENVEEMWHINQGLEDLSVSSQPIMIYECKPYKTLNPKAVNAAPKYFSNPLKNDWFQIRLENSLFSNYQIVHKFSLSQNTDSNV